MLATASAVIFNYVDTNVERRPGQYFVFYSQESPIHMSQQLNRPNGCNHPKR
ncbi:unnamed protein product [Meloidogyne enterolobii]|uniref:Uncharacterized protein n=2 Tax=Meloidogyne enterolobii TaxID=390850 RepID=A0ACB0Y2N6_MELEN|nr:unnamed protein product [Meloidogyne enterolobii]